MLTRTLIDQARIALRAGRRDEAAAIAEHILDVFERYRELDFGSTRDAILRSGIPELVRGFAARHDIDWRRIEDVLSRDFFGEIDTGDRAGHVEALLEAGAPRKLMLSGILASRRAGGRVDALVAHCRHTARTVSADEAIMAIAPHLKARTGDAARDIAAFLEEAAPRAKELHLRRQHISARAPSALVGLALVRAGLPAPICAALAETAPSEQARDAFAQGVTRHARLALIAREPSLSDMILEASR